jgi:3-hydroxyisobutyrate dehydrogenase-like beta-hydroxyacid dehydrogenase
MDRIVGVIGLGIMGGAIARNLVDRGWTVIGFDLDEKRRDELAGAGVCIAGRNADIAEVAPIIITSLPSPRAAEAVARDIAASGAERRIVVETSTLALADKLAFASILAEAGHVPLDCPLSGTGAQAKNRDLVVYASGDSDAIAQCGPLFQDFAKQSADLGAFGNGSKMKFVANHLVAIHNVAAAEAMVLARKAGLDLHQVIEMIAPGAGGSRMFQMRAPMMAEGRYEPPTMRVSTWKKDMEIIGSFAESMDCPAPLFRCTEPVYARAVEMGLGELDTAAVCIVLEEEAGVRA